MPNAGEGFLPVIQENIRRPDISGRQSDTLYSTIVAHIPAQLVVFPFLQTPTVTEHTYSTVMCLLLLVIAVVVVVVVGNISISKEFSLY